MSQETDMLALVGKAFSIKGDVIDFNQIQTGHINKTYYVQFSDESENKGRYILQSMNRYVFKDIDGMMNNIFAVTEHLQRKIKEEGGNPQREALNFLTTSDNGLYYISDTADIWRAYHYVGEARTYNVANDMNIFTNAGIGFGRFQRRLSDFDINSLTETLPDFHNTEKRLNDFFDAYKKDTENRADEIRNEAEFLYKNRELCSTLVKLIKENAIPLRVTHNDTKYNNILIDDFTGEALCVIDLDTVMPGLSVYDFGDAIRYAANSAVEDETNPEKINLDMNKYEAFTKGFIGASEGYFDDTEIEYMALGARLMTIECGARFLEDYLRGDKYFKIHRPKQNLDRGKCQIKLALSMEEKYDDMKKIVYKYNKKQ